jgi:hypothetical protein
MVKLQTPPAAPEEAAEKANNRHPTPKGAFDYKEFTSSQSDDLIRNRDFPAVCEGAFITQHLWYA